MVRVEEQTAARMRGLADDPAHHVEVVELLGLRVELDGQAHAVLGRDARRLAYARGGAGQIAAAAVGRAHHGGAAELTRPAAGLGERVQQLPRSEEHTSELQSLR